MKQLIYIILLTSTIWLSCGSSRSSTKSETSIVRNDSLTKNINVSSTSTKGIVSLIESNEAMNIHLKWYDTSKPINPDTGKPPLLGEADVNKDSSKKENTTINENDSTNINANTSLSSRSQKNNKVDIDKQKDETTVPQQIGWMCVGIAILIVAIIIGWLVYRMRKK